MSHETHWDPATRELIARAEARGAERVAQAVERLTDELPALTEGLGRRATARWPERDRDIYSLAIEEVRAIMRALVADWVVDGDERPAPEPPSDVTEDELALAIRNAGISGVTSDYIGPFDRSRANAVLAAFHVTRRDGTR